MYLRVFGLSERQPNPDALVGFLRHHGFDLSGRFRTDDRGWVDGELAVADTSILIPVERFLADEDGIRRQLSTWAAWVESVESEHQTRLMQHLISTRQLFTIDLSSAGALPVAGTAGRYLARETDGVYQIDDEGFFAADGTLLVPEEPDHP